jgi:hypothetical protein
MGGIVAGRELSSTILIIAARHGAIVGTKTTILARSGTVQGRGVTRIGRNDNIHL